MDEKEIIKLIDHTQLQADATWEDIVSLCDDSDGLYTANIFKESTRQVR